MAMIESIDASALINSYRQGRADSLAFQKARMEQVREQEFNGLASQLYGNRRPTTIADQAAQPVASPPETFDDAFSTEGLANAGPEAVTRSPPQAPESPTQGPALNRDVMQQMVFLDAPRAKAMFEAFNTMDAGELKRAEAKNSMLAAAAQRLSTVPMEQRKAYLQSIAPALQSVGFSPQELAQADLSDRGLYMYQATGVDVDHLIDNALEERKFQQGQIVTPQPGAGAFRVRPDGSTDTIVAPNDGSHPVGSRVQPSAGPQVGAVVSGYRFKGGNPNDRASWEPAGGGAGNGVGGF